MITVAEFENLLNNSESSILDFKRINYSVDNGPENASKFVKDIISFANTIRTKSAFIILGVDVKQDNSKELIGITDYIDEAIFQDKIKDKVFPRPIFKYSTIVYKNLSFGVIEIPVSKYALPISPTIKLKGLEPGKIYFRRGSSNSEASGVETININEWLKSLPEVNQNSSLHDELTSFLKRITKGDEKLSVILTDLLNLSKKHKLIELINFCSAELSGVGAKVSNVNPDEYKYRIVGAKISLNKIELNPYSFLKATEAMLKAEMDKNKDFYDLRLMFSKPITEIEEHVSRINDDTICSIIQTSSKKIFPTENTSDYIVYLYIFKNEYSNLYRNIRQKAIDKLMKV